ncbi:MAG: hypothetical protein ABFC54_09755 [Thermoguttaceae bacterium]
MSDSEYLCPGQRHPISRAVHLGRLAAFYPPCRACPHRHDVGASSPRQQEQRRELEASGPPVSVFDAEGLSGALGDPLTPELVRCVAAAFAVETQASRAENEGIKGPTLLLLAGDGRAATAELMAAACEGLRWNDCDVIDLGATTSAGLAMAVAQFAAAGGLYLGNAGFEPHRASVRFWASGPRPISAGPTLDRIRRRADAGAERTSRTSGSVSRASAEATYWPSVAEHYHALRPLRIVIDSASGPWLDGLQRLAAIVACQIVPCRASRGDLSRQVRATESHLGLCVDGDGERCVVWDQRGRPVPTERLLTLLARELSSQGEAAVVVEASAPSAMIRALERLGVRVTVAESARAAMSAAMFEHSALLGGGPSGRFWHSLAGVPLPDALMTLTRLLVALSRGDEPFSVVLDREAPLG